MGKNLVTSYAALGVGLAIVLTFGLAAISSVTEQPSQDQFMASQRESEKMVPVAPAPEAPAQPSKGELPAMEAAPPMEKPPMAPPAAQMGASIPYPIKIIKSELIDQLGNVLTSSRVDAPVGIEVELKNTSPDKVVMIYIVQVKDSEGVTVFLTWIRDLPLPSDESAKPAIFWTPLKSGRYFVEVFVWNSITEAEPLSSPIEMSIKAT